MSSKYRSRIKSRKPRKIRGGGIAEAVEKAPEVYAKVQRGVQKGYRVAKEVVPVAKKVGKETRKLA